ncbi:5831_t:CDS:1, partial [Gigaspora margarita]
STEKETTEEKKIKKPAIGTLNKKFYETIWKFKCETVATWKEQS